VGAHTHTNSRNLTDLVVADDFTSTDVLAHAFKNALGFFEVATVHGKREIGSAVMAGVLDNDVDINIGFSNGAEDLVGNAGFVGHAEYCEFGFVAVKGNAGDDGLFHVRVVLNCDKGAFATLTVFFKAG